MKDAILATAAGIVLLVALAAIGFAGNAFGFWQWSYFAPKIVGVQNQVFHQSQQYTDGMVNQLEQYREAYDSGTDEQKAATCSVVRSQYASYPRSAAQQLTPVLSSFLNTCMEGSK